MTSLLIMLIGFVGIYGVYIAARVAAVSAPGTALVDGGQNLPGWATMFVAAALTVCGAGFMDHVMLVGRYGLQASHVAIGLILAAMTAVMIHKRLWIASRVSGLTTPGAVLGAYYQSVTIRIVMMALAIGFGLPFAANLLAGAGRLLADATQGAIPVAVAVWVIAFFLFLPAVIGGWRATVLAAAMQAVLLTVLLLATTGFAELTLPGPGFETNGIAVLDGILRDQIPGVIQYSAGISKSVTQGGLFTAVAILSTALIFIGVTLSPAMGLLEISARPGRSLAFGSVWLTGGLAAALLLFVLPFLVARMPQGIVALANSLAAVEIFAGAGLVLMMCLAPLAAISLYTTAGALLLNRDLIETYVLPDLDEKTARLAARITLAVAFFILAVLAAFAPLTSAIIASLALPMSVQMLPAFLGLAFVRWISRSAILTGLIIGSLFVFFTEPPGLILVEGLFGNLPWGRWPLTIHSVTWGLALNVAAVLLVSIFTRAGEERLHRDRLHDEFAARWQVDFGGSTARGAKWSLTLIWAFLAIGPGAILGNSFFSQPIFTEGAARLGVPSLWIWQIFFWLIGVPLVWWLAYRSRLGITSDAEIRHVDLADGHDGPVRTGAPVWIAGSLARISER